MIEISKNVFISENELVFRASRSSGPGGQNVNKLNTKVTLFFNIKKSENFSDNQKKLILENLSSRIDKTGFIRIVSQKFRTQKANRVAAIQRLQKLLSDALTIKHLRKKTKVTYKAKQKRLNEKKIRSTLKKQRSDKDFDF